MGRLLYYEHNIGNPAQKQLKLYDILYYIVTHFPRNSV